MSEPHLAPSSQTSPQLPPSQPLPQIVLGLTQYRDFAARNALFVDKTALLQKLVDQKFVLLSRPRRFGKTVLVSMLTELFTYGVKNFQGKAIYERWYEKTYPVLNLSLAGLTNPDTFETDLCTVLRDACYAAGFHEIYNFIPECTDFRTLSGRVVRQVLKGQQAVLLIDEWEDPLLAKLNDHSAHEKISDLMRYLSIWTRESHAFWFVLVTGRTRNPPSSFIWDSFKNISKEPYFATLLGYTPEELQTNFGPYLSRCAERNHCSTAEVLAQIERTCARLFIGKDEIVQVYCPEDIHRFFCQETALSCSTL